MTVTAVSKSGPSDSATVHISLSHIIMSYHAFLTCLLSVYLFNPYLLDRILSVTCQLSH